MGDRRNTLADTISLFFSTLYDLLNTIMSIILSCGFIYFGLSGMFKLGINLFKFFIGV